MPENHQARGPISWSDWVYQRLSLSENETLERAHTTMLRSGADYGAILGTNGELTGMICFKHVAAVLSAKFGQALFSRRRLGEIRVYGKLLGSDAHEKETLHSVVIPLGSSLVFRPDDDFFQAQRKFEARPEWCFFQDIIVVDDDDAFVGFMSVRDFSKLQHRVILEQEFELKTRNDTLKQTLDSLSRTQGELINAAKMASLGELVAGIAHEMNTPLGILLSSQDVVARVVDKLRSRVGPAQRAKLRGMLDSNIALGRCAADKVSDIVRSLRIFGRDDKELRHEADLVGLIRSALILHSNSFKKAITVSTELPDRATLSCFPGQLSQVFVNLLTNAYQAMDGQGEIQVALHEESSMWICEVRDTGPGFSDEVIDRVFDPGFTTKGVGVGTGLGLSISRRLIESNHKGKISARNHPQGGAIIRLELPIRAPEAPASPKKKAVADSALA